MLWLILSGLVFILTGLIYKHATKPEKPTLEEYEPKKYQYMMPRRKW